MVDVERVSAILSLRAVIQKNDTSLKYCRFNLIRLTEPRIGRIRTMLYIHGRQGLKVLYLPPTRSLSKYGGISARISPTCNLTNLYNYSQRSACVGFPCNGLAPISRSSLSLRCTSDTYSLHMHRISSFKKANRS